MFVRYPLVVMVNNLGVCSDRSRGCRVISVGQVTRLLR